MRIGLVVNPDAGLGGRLGFKGSDGRASEARSAGAQDRAGPRMEACLTHLAHLVSTSLNRTHQSFELVTWEGRMGSSWIPQTWSGPLLTTQSIGATPEQTSAQDTHRLVEQLFSHDVDLILYAGGDGTTRDIVSTLAAHGASSTPMVGVPGGVKMHSGCFATNPKGAAEVTLSFAVGDLMTAITEVMDLDEEIYQQGTWKVTMYGEAWTPSSPRFMQGAKEQVERSSEEETLEALAQHVQAMLDENPDLLIVWGSGGTIKRIGEHLGYELTLLGIDISVGDMMYNDVNEVELLEALHRHMSAQTKIKLLLSPMGGQGFLIGRGNLQLSPEVLRTIGIENVLGIATPAKLLGLDSLRIDTGDEALDEMFHVMKFIKVVQGFRTTRLLRISD